MFRVLWTEKTVSLECTFDGFYELNNDEPAEKLQIVLLKR